MKYKKYRPKAEDYDGFVELMKDKISKYQPSTCFFIYGSYARGDHDIGRSDIDGGIILDSGVVTDKTKVMELVNIMKECLEECRVRPQFSFLDRVSNRDGRFLSYGKDFTDYLKNEGVVICGPNYIGEMDGIKSKDIPLNTTAFNFRKIRNSFLFSLDNLYTNYEKFIEDFENSLGTISRLPKDLILISNGNLITNKNKAKERIFETFPDLDLGYLYKIEHLFKHNEEMDELFERPDDILSLWDGALTTFEQMIDAFIKKYPK